MHLLGHQALQAHLRGHRLHAAVRDRNEVRNGVQYGLQHPVRQLGVHGGLRRRLLLRLQHGHELRAQLWQCLLDDRLFLIGCLKRGLGEATLADGP